MIRAAHRTFHASPVLTRHAGLPVEASRLRGDLERQIEQTTEQLVDVAQLRSRAYRCRALHTLGETQAPALAALQACSARLGEQADGCDPEIQALRDRVSGLLWSANTITALANLMRGYRDQLPFEPKVMDEPWTHRLMSEMTDLCAWLAASADEAQRDRAALLIAIVPPEHRAPFMALAPAGSPLRAQVDGWIARHNGRTLDLQQLLMMRFVAHPYSAVFPAFSGLDVAAQVARPLAEALASTADGLVEFREAAVAACESLPGLCQTREGASFIKGGTLQGNPVLRKGLQAYQQLAFNYSTSATIRRLHAYIGARGQGPAGDALLVLHCGGLGGGPIRAVSADLFNPEATYAQGEVLLVGPHSFRVTPGRSELHRDREGGCTEVQHFDLHKIRDGALKPEDVG